MMIVMINPRALFGRGSSKGLWLPVSPELVAPGDDVSVMRWASLVVVFADQGHAVETVVLQHVHDAHEVTVGDVLVATNENPLVGLVTVGAELPAQVVAQSGDV